MKKHIKVFAYIIIMFKDQIYLHAPSAQVGVAKVIGLALLVAMVQ